LKDFFRHNGILLLIAAILLAAVTVLASFFLNGMANPLAGLVGVVTTPVRSGLNAVANWMEDRYDYAFKHDELVEQNRQLLKKVAEMEEEIRQAQAANDENERLRNLMGLAQKRRDFVLESATITAIGPSNWESTVTISKGESAGIAPQQCVVDEFGNLVGIVTTVGPNWATVTTLVDTGTEMGGLIGRTDTAAILEGDFDLMGKGKLKLSYVPESSELILGDEILTSGRGGVYPSGLVVGSVAQVQTDPSGLGRYAIVQPAVDLMGLRQVFVIKEFNVVE
jgi:rod shape-determining protein MreC